MVSTKEDMLIVQLHDMLRIACYRHLTKLCEMLTAHAPGVTARLTETFRSNERQQRLFAEGRSRAATGVQSPHCKSLPDGTPAALAWDIVLIENGALLGDSDLRWHLIPASLGLVDTDLKLTSGADFKSIKDFPHTEFAGWKRLVAEGKVK